MITLKVSFYSDLKNCSSVVVRVCGWSVCVCGWSVGGRVYLLVVFRVVDILSLCNLLFKSWFSSCPKSDT